jgi:hypothetical protein
MPPLLVLVRRWWRRCGSRGEGASTEPPERVEETEERRW